MKKLTKMSTGLLLAASMVLIYSCAGASDNKAADADVKEEPVEIVNASYGADVETGAAAVAQGYFMIKDALVNEDLEGAKAGAQKIMAAYTNVDVDELGAAILEDAEHIEETETIGDQRDHFNTLSDNVFTLLSAQSSHPVAVYQQHCPMAMEGNGANWLSLSKEIRNPYYGDKMLKCGKVMVTLN